MKFFILALVWGSHTVFALPALAQNTTPTSPFYGGLALGIVTISDASHDTAARLSNSLGGRANVSQDGSAYMGRVFGGKDIAPSFSVELGYHQSASVAQKITGTASNGAAYTGTASFGVNGWDYSILLRPHRTHPQTGPFLRLGGHYLKANGNASLTATSVMTTASDYNGSGFLWGVGYDMPIKDSFNLRLEYLGFRNIAAKDGNSDNYCAAVVRYF